MTSHLIKRPVIGNREGPCLFLRGGDEVTICGFILCLSEGARKSNDVERYRYGLARRVSVIDSFETVFMKTRTENVSNTRDTCDSFILSDFTNRYICMFGCIMFTEDFIYITISDIIEFTDNEIILFLISPFLAIILACQILK